MAKKNKYETAAAQEELIYRCLERGASQEEIKRSTGATDKQIESATKSYNFNKGMNHGKEG